MPGGRPAPTGWERPARPVPLTLPLLAQSVSAEKKRLLLVHSLDFDADSDDSSPPGSYPPSLKVSGLSLPCHPSRITGAPGRGQGWPCSVPGTRARWAGGSWRRGTQGPETSHPPRGRISREMGCRAAELGARGIRGGCLSPE